MTMLMIVFVILMVAPATIISIPHTNFEALLLVEQWPPAVCRLQRCDKDVREHIPNIFGIHGLWPHNYTHNVSPKHCGGRDDGLNTFLPADLLRVLRRYWPSLFDHHDLMFWAGEWSTHGTCSNIDDGQRYLRAAVDLCLVHEIKEALRVAGIVPGSIHTPEAFFNAIHSSTGVRPMLKCGNPRHGIPLLTEVTLCLDNTATQFEDCRNRRYNRCGHPQSGQIEFHA